MPLAGARTRMDPETVVAGAAVWGVFWGEVFLIAGEATAVDPLVPVGGLVAALGMALLVGYVAVLEAPGGETGAPEPR